ncbi:MAG TPA: hypothetical protein VHO68_13595, partial [Bacteroidales bacterium]|nr:hypothetical protein [Bacteroidales bacterium]
VETKIADTLLTIKYPDIKKGSRINLYFGLCNSGNFKTTDVPAMELRDIIIKNGDRIIHHWPLNEISGTNAADVEGKLNSSVINPLWLKSEHYNWKEVFGTEAEGCMWCAFDTIRDEVIILNQHKITRLSVTTGMPVEVIPVNTNLNILNSRQTIYDYISDRVILIDIDKPSISWFDFKTLMWNGDLKAGLKESDFNHYNKFYSGLDTSIYFFGGYGHHKYKNQVQKYKLSQGTIEKLNTFGDFYNPRYLAGLGKLNDTIYLIGGFGSESGEQILTPHSYFDMMAYSIKSRSFVRKFEISPKPEDHAFSNSIIIDPHDRSYYGLIFPIFSYNGYLQLIKGSLDSPGYKNLGSRIPYQFLDIKSFSDLYFSKKSGKFIAVTINNEADKSQLKVFTLGFPPDEQSELTLSSPASNKNLVLIILSAILLIIISSVIIFVRRRKDVLNKQPDKESPSKESHEFYVKGPSNVSYLNFFGEFQVVSFSGEDITRKFTPLLKELFLLIWLNSIKNDIGISNEKIVEILWHDFSETSAQNNKAVNIAKLRAILSENFSCGLTYKNTGYWRIDYKNKNVVNDYYEFLKITSVKNELSKQEVLKLVEFSQKGPFLANLKYSWLEEYKVSVSNEMINRLIKYLKSL